jgi:hypothetical protein
MINTCAFGSMVIDGKRYTSDLIIFPDGGVKDSWWRKKGHRLTIDDIKGLIETRPEVIVAGTGDSGLMRPEKILEKYLLQEGIEFKHASNLEAVEIYNDLILKKKRVGACFHLTC